MIGDFLLAYLALIVLCWLIFEKPYNESIRDAMEEIVYLSSSKYIRRIIKASVVIIMLVILPILVFIKIANIIYEDFNKPKRKKMK
mgnify:CR=1 FL=1